MVRPNRLRLHPPRERNQQQHRRTLRERRRNHLRRLYGYTYLRRTPTSAPALVINEEQAAIVRFIFETYASNDCSTAAIGRILEGRGVPTYRGGRFWEHGRIIQMLKNPTYTGVRYFNQTMVVHDVPGTEGVSKRKRMAYRDPSEWIAIKVPAIVSQELFDQVQARLHVVQSRYRKLPMTALLSGFIRCADCGRLFAHGYTNERYRLRTGGTDTRERGQYRCSKRVDDPRLAFAGERDTAHASLPHRGRGRKRLQETLAAGRPVWLVGAGRRLVQQDMKAIAAYCRSACEPQRGPSPVLAQAQALRDDKPDISQVYMDAGVSGLTLERPALERLIADCRAGKIATVIVQDPERLSRDIGQLKRILQIFQEAGVRVEFATGGDPVLAPALSVSAFTVRR